MHLNNQSKKTWLITTFIYLRKVISIILSNIGTGGISLPKHQSSKHGVDYTNPWNPGMTKNKRQSNQNRTVMFFLTIITKLPVHTFPY